MITTREAVSSSMNNLKNMLIVSVNTHDFLANKKKEYRWIKISIYWNQEGREKNSQSNIHKHEQHRNRARQ